NAYGQLVIQDIIPAIDFLRRCPVELPSFCSQKAQLALYAPAILDCRDILKSDSLLDTVKYEYIGNPMFMRLEHFGRRMKLILPRPT
ncbi:hypothetical protein AX16_001938, partial [Volvariella volvacea WC 439]